MGSIAHFARIGEFARNVPGLISIDSWQHLGLALEGKLKGSRPFWGFTHSETCQRLQGPRLMDDSGA